MIYFPIDFENLNYNIKGKGLVESYVKIYLDQEDSQDNLSKHNDQGEADRPSTQLNVQLFLGILKCELRRKIFINSLFK